MRCPACCFDISVSRSYVDLINKANKARQFLEDHPALGGPLFNFLINLDYSAQEVCKRGYCRLDDGLITISNTPENYSRYKDKFDREQETLIEVPYNDYFGESWQFDHVEYWSELSFRLFTSKNYKEAAFDLSKWVTLHGIESNGRSFEELLINTAEEFRKYFGDFSSEDFLTIQEKLNHKNNSPFIKTPHKRKPDILKSNDQYVFVSNAELNHRWLEWFLKTDYCKKNWPNIMEMINV